MRRTLLRVAQWDSTTIFPNALQGRGQGLRRMARVDDRLEPGGVHRARQCLQVPSSPHLPVRVRAAIDALAKKLPSVK
ncbi:hypothetical protein HJC22_13490 [Corallococcus exiguus]|uniref:hypothetical protein n=1 Tax=Corallococcus TaxID=83461 RepID=UPI0013153DD1|nr:MULTISPECIES: hypothetical protein [Corallococcus]NNC16730.1 hypothetical protein [Corallococcus exiguus]